MCQKTILKFVLFLGIIALTSCEGNTDRIRIIQNNTSGTIQVIATGSIFDKVSKSILSGQSETLFISNQRGGSSYIEVPATGLDTLIITNSLGDTCKKDFLLQSNWNIRTEQTRKRPSNWQHEYKFAVTDSDF